MCTKSTESAALLCQGTLGDTTSEVSHECKKKNKKYNFLFECHASDSRDTRKKNTKTYVFFECQRECAPKKPNVLFSPPGPLIGHFLFCSPLPSVGDPPGGRGSVATRPFFGPLLIKAVLKEPDFFFVKDCP